MNENETKKETETEVSSSSNNESKVEGSEVKASYTAMPKEGNENKRWIPYVIAVAVVAILLGGVLYKLESEGRSSTNIFGSIIEMQQSDSVKAVVNGVEITKSDLDLSIKQFEQAAVAQGVDMTSPDVMADISAQALEVLINTELLRQEAERQGHTISDEEVNARLDAIKVEIGSAEVLEERMQSLGIDEEGLFDDVSNELLIQKLLDQKFAEADVVVSEEEISQFYESVGGGAEGAPSLEEVRTQIVEQLTATKQQQIVNETLSELKTVAEVEIF